jgi:hypothetical protein
MFDLRRNSTGIGYTTAVTFFTAASIFSPAMLAAAEDFSSYRGFQFGSNLSVAAKQAGAQPSEAILMHQRPAVIQELNWRPGSPMQADPAKTGAVQDAQLFFYNGDLFRIVVTYDRYKVEGMTAEDMIEAISVTYGTATRPAAEIAYRSDYGEVAPVIARWEDSAYSYNLVRTGDQSSFAMILYSKRVDALAQAATTEAARLEAEDAPKQEVQRQKNRAEEARVHLENARLLNKPNFRP